MPLEHTFLPQNKGRPNGLFDFDERLGFAPMVLRSDTGGEAVWSTKWWWNAIGVVLVLGLGGGFVAAVHYREPIWTSLSEAHIVARFVLGAIAVVIGYCALMSLYLAVYRGKLVIDRVRCELHFAYLLRPFTRKVVRFGDVRALAYLKIDGTPDIDSGHVHSTMVLCAELHDGTLLCLASDSPGLYGALKDAIRANDPQAQRPRKRAAVKTPIVAAG